MALVCLADGPGAQSAAYDPDDLSAQNAVRAMYTEQLGWAVEEGIDFVISETNDYLGEALLALKVIQGLGLPAMVTLAPTQPDRTRDGYSYVEACRILAAEGAQVVGLNCDRGPQTMMPLIAGIREKVDCAVAAQPVPYRTDAAALTMQTLQSKTAQRAFPLALEPFGCTRFEMAQFALQARDLGVDYVGICCGAGPHHVRGHGRGARPRGPSQQILAVDGPAPHVPATGLSKRRHVSQLLERLTSESL